MATQKATLGTLYELNQAAYSKVKPMTPAKASEMVFNIGMWFSSDPTYKYFMFLCRELNDYTIFDFRSYNYSKGEEELEDLIHSRGELLDIQYDHENDNYDIWVKSKQDNKPHVYKLFDCNDFVIPIE